MRQLSGFVRASILFALLIALCSSTGCSSAYYSTMEKFGYHKRDLLVSRVEDASESQGEAKEQFKSALERFNSVVRYEGGDLQSKYETLQAEFDQSEAAAKDVRKRIDSVENVAEALFDEWEDELRQYSNAQLKRSSERSLEDTRRRYKPMISAMRKVERKMDPVLGAFRDQVLFLKHNLNARAIASLKSEFQSVESDIASLVQDMEASIRESQAFVKTLNSSSKS